MSRTEGLRANSSQFTLEGEPFHILGGSIHYFRVPRAYWGDRLLKMKACGVNALTTYVPWNLHEPDRGVFNFQDQLDLEAYISLAAELWLWVIMDLGELPSYLHIINTQHSGKLQKEFTDPVSCFFDQLVPILVPHQYSNGGTIIAVEVENEYGSYAKDNEYMPVVKEGLLSRGITELLLTSDYQDGL